ncbi:uncharacterized protein EI97DRAFT_483213 [Westerdykella ornata]|uniref:Uncharacterized protein n=1 Tax=Westerdykella ornata TaxID=318751 RepID=A0A6A6JA49_WESOR|nr:uncharacterized protein EI97DRAFT_483213 [Westerdykella ornata]KAF2272838.1 hypothetical protein EI97DRAFT_483213 [Westerdykella ornata]
MDDAIRISDEQFRSIYERSFKRWARLYSHVTKDSPPPAYCLFTKDAFSQHPFFPRNLSLKHDNGQVFASGLSVWGSTGATCNHRLPTFRQPVRIGVTRKDPVSLSISETAQRESSYPPWFARDENYLAVLILAWAYILSARWTEIIPEPCSLRYTDCQATYQDATTSHLQNAINIDIGNVDPEETRWWAAVLAPGQGWQATMALEQDSFSSPWSIRLQSGPQFCLSRVMNASPSPHMTPSFSEACSYLNRFCEYHNIIDQSHAALAAPEAITDLPFTCYDGQLHHDWIHQGHHLDKLLTLSCNTTGIRPMLLGIFYKPSVECNAVTPWLQGALAAINHLAGNDLYVLGRMCMERAPEVAYLWLGCTILGLQKKLLQDVRFGLIPTDLHAAVWSGTVQSFIQQPVSHPLVVHGHVARADECRLLFLSQKNQHARVPVCQWKPFGATPLEDVDVEVRVHAECEAHGLQYQGFFWDCTNDELEFQSLDEEEAVAHIPRSRSPAQEIGGAGQVPVFYEALDRRKEVISENATRSILGWLRFDGHAWHEREIWKHEWFDMYDSDEEDVGWNEVCSNDGPKPPSRVKSWISGLNSSISADSDTTL